MSTSTSKTTSTGATRTSASSTIRPGLRVGEHVCAVQFAAWGPQDTSVKASTGGGRGGAPYVVVQVGASLTYAYDQAAIDSFLCTDRSGPISRLTETYSPHARELRRMDRGSNSN